MASRAGPVWCALLTAVLLLLATARARALDQRQVPEPLRPWVAWAEDVPAPCPTVGEEATCVWPGMLALDLDDRGGRFQLEVTVDRESDVTLPGSTTRWPEEVSGAGNTLPIVLEKEGVPTVRLPAGSYTLRGRFTWTNLPETLPVPKSLALLELRVGGKVVPRPRRDKGQVWLKGDPRLDEEPESLDLTVYRNLEDGVPFRIDTRLELTASGRAREVMLGNVLLDGAIPLNLEAALPVRIEQGLLYAQVSPGKHEIRFESLLPTPPEALSRPAKDSVAAAIAFWPEHEVWVWSPAGLVRQVDVSGAAGIDPAQTELPAEWKQLAAYSVPRGGQLTLTTKRRGQPDAPPNRLALQRTLWLDLDGGGYTVRDTFTGSMNRDWRLDMALGRLGRVAVDGDDQLVTRNPVNGLSGVELRQGKLHMTAEWQLRGDVRKLRAVGWSEDVQQLSTQINVPPGWRILSASGVDSISETWLSSWNLFALFFVLVVALSIGKLVGPGWGLLALFALTLSHDEAGAPFASWLVLVVGVALCKVVPRGWFRHLVTAFTAISGVVLGIIVIGFAVTQVRSALYPQVGADGGDWFDFAPGAQMASMEADNMEGGTGLRASGGRYDNSTPADAKVREPEVQRQQDPEAVIQTGPGVPTWNWYSWQLSWSGPVHRDHQIRLLLLSPTESRILSLLRMLTTALLAFWLLRFGLRALRKPPGRGPDPRVVASAAKLFAASAFLGVALWPGAARADIPDPEMLDQLHTRLSPPAECAPNCASVSLLEVEATQTDLRIRLEAHAGDTVSIQLPGPAQNWLPRRVTVDGRSSDAMVLGSDGFLHLQLAKGKHRVELTGPVGREVSLILGTKPHRVEVDARDWEVDGLSSNGQVDGPLVLRRSQAVETPAEAGGVEGTVTLPVWVAVSRTIDFGVNWTVHTELKRIGPVGTQVALRVPLVLGERVTTPGVTQQGHDAVVNLGREQAETAFDSNVAIADSLDLTASTGRNLSERWVLRCSTVWHCETSGLPPITHQQAGHQQPEFLPWPGENLHITLARPAPEEGRHTTIDSATLALTPGVRLLHADLQLGVRTSTQGSVTVTLRQQSEVQELTVDGTAQPFSRGESQLNVSLPPGQHDVHLTWQEPGGMKARFVAPPVQLDGEVVNARVTIDIPDERWLLFATGPSWGPAILFWGYLVLILLLAPVLGALPGSRLESWQWAVLGIGLTQVPVVVSALIVGWFFAFSLTSRARPFGRVAHNFAQLGLVFYTLVFVGCLFGAVYDGLLSSPDMEVTGAGSSNHRLAWYVDRLSGALPTPTVFSTSLWAYRIAMLLWALWLSWNLIQWLRWAFEVFAADGFWKRGPRRPPPSPAGGMPFVPYPVSPGPVTRAGSAAPSSAVAASTTSGSAVPATLGSTDVGTPSQQAATQRDRPSAPEMPTESEGQSRFETTFADEKTPIEPVALLVEKRRQAERSQSSDSPPSEAAANQDSDDTTDRAADPSPQLPDLSQSAAERSTEPGTGPERPTLSYSTRDEPSDLATEGDDPTRDELEERPTLPLSERREQEPFTFTAFDFRAASSALDRIDETPDVTGTKPAAANPTATAEEAPTESQPIEEPPPPSRVGTPPPKPPGHKSDPPAAGPFVEMKLRGMATPPGGFALEELQGVEPAKEPPRSSRPPPKPKDDSDEEDE
jgi:hypothetical protein